MTGFCLVLFLIVATSVQAKIPDQERAALVALYDATGGDQWSDKSQWLVPATDECTWHGVTCGAPDVAGVKHVTEIDLTFNNLVGSLPDEIAQLTQLQTLRFHDDMLTGQIPSLAALTQLSAVDVHNNQITGSIPALTGLTNLAYFNVGDNQLSGTLPSLAGLVNLGIFGASANQLTGSIP